MTHEQFDAEIMYIASIAPFAKMRDEGIISDDDFSRITEILRGKYSPIFIEK